MQTVHKGPLITEKQYELALTKISQLENEKSELIRDKNGLFKQTQCQLEKIQQLDECEMDIRESYNSIFGNSVCIELLEFK